MPRNRDLAKQRSYERAWYARHADKAKEKARLRRQAVAEWFRSFKASLHCVVCGENDPVCLDFHHRNPDEKDFSVFQAARRGMGVARLLAETAKCDVLCANCHRKLHRDLRDLEGNNPPVAPVSDVSSPPRQEDARLTAEEEIENLRAEVARLQLVFRNLEAQNRRKGPKVLASKRR